MFSKENYITRRNVLREKTGSGVILLLGNEEVGINYRDNVFTFRQDSTFLYYFGLDKPGLAAVIDTESGNDIVFGDNPSMDDVVWTGPQILIQDQAVRCGIGEVQPLSVLNTYIKESFEKGLKIRYLLPYRYRQHLFLSELFSKSVEEVKKGISIELTKNIVDQRLIKGDEEIGELDKAVSITSKMHLRAMEYARPGMKEQHVMAEIYRIALEEGPGVSFSPIVSIRGEVLHNQHYNNTLKEGQLLLVDAGAESGMHYAGDMTRTFPVSGTFTGKQSDVYQIVLNAQNAAIEALRPGIPYKEVHLLAANTIVDGLKTIGIMKGDTQEAVSAGAHAMFFPHGLGHMMGLDVHDMENFGEKYVGYDESTDKSEQFGLNFLRLAKKLVPGYVLTIEPGIYFIPPLIEKWKNEKKSAEFINFSKLDKYLDFGGIRIEEDFLITSGGSRLLGSPVAKEIAEVETIRAGA
ncbi:MAG: aminopeptidase P family protein [Bacteroidetes bacterium]|nr:aminopeptidase P family protein [Bacteroidota bacterium]